MRDPTDIDSRDGRPTRSSVLTIVGLLVGAVLVAVLLGTLTDPDPAQQPPTAVVTTSAPDLRTTPGPDKPIGVDSINRCLVDLGGLALGGSRQVAMPAVDRWDCDAPHKGPWSAVIRAAGGHFGVHGAVVTLPVDRKVAGIPVTRPRGGVWDAGAQVLVWPIAGSHAQVAGDVGQSGLADIAMHVTIENGRPHLASLGGFVVATTLSYRSPAVHEMRYSTKDLGQLGTLGNGLVHTGVTQGASFESRAFEAHAKLAGLVRGKPAIYFSDMQSGDRTLAWESQPGEVFYISYSGSATQADPIEALRALADKGRVLTPAQWKTKDRIAIDSK